MLELYIRDRVTDKDDRRTGTLLELPATFVFPAGTTTETDPETGALRVRVAAVPDETVLVEVVEEPA